MKSKTILLISTILTIAATHFETTAQNLRMEYVGIGYNLSYAPLRRVNEFIDLYNAAETKINGAVIEIGMKNIRGLTGINFVAAASLDKVIFDINWTRRSKEVFANYELPFHDERHIKYSFNTLTTGFLAPIYNQEKISIYAGMGVNFIAGKLETYILSETPSQVFKKLNGFGNFGIEPVVQLFYTPMDNFPLKLGVRAYYQANLFKNDMSGLETEMYNHWKRDKADLKSGGSNIGVILQALIVIPNFKAKHSEKKEKVEKVQETPLSISKVKFIALAIDSATQKPINALVTIVNKNGNKTSISTGKDQGNSTYLINNDEYQIEIDAFGYESKFDKISLINSSLNQVNKQYELTMIKIGEKVTLNNIYFEKASATLLNESMPELDKILAFMTNNPLVSIELSGHTSSEGKDDYNLQLSSERASAIKEWLVNKGTNPKRIVSIGHGKTKPIADNDTEEGRKLNRRVELKIIKIEK